MRDIDTMAATMRRLHDSGADFAHRLQACPHAFVRLTHSALQQIAKKRGLLGTILT